MKKILLIAIAALMGLTMNAQLSTRQEAGVAQSRMMKPAEKKADLSAVKQMQKQPGQMVRMSKDYGKKLTLKSSDLRPVSHVRKGMSKTLLKKVSLPASLNRMTSPMSSQSVTANKTVLNMHAQRKAVGTEGLKAVKSISTKAPLKAGAIQAEYHATGVNIGYDATTDTDTEEPVEWTMTPASATLEDETVVNVLFDVVPEPDTFKSIYEDGIPLEYTIDGNTLTIEPQIIASGDDPEEGKFYVYVFSAYTSGTITFTLGEDGSLKSAADQEIIIGALNTNEFSLTQETFMWYYQWTEKIKYRFEGQAEVVSPFNETYTGSGYDYFEKKSLSWTMTPDAEESTLKCFLPAADETLAKFFPDGIDVPYTIKNNQVSVKPYYLGLGYTEDDGTKVYLTLFGITDNNKNGSMAFTLGEDKSLTPKGNITAVIGVFLNTTFDETLTALDGAYMNIQNLTFAEGGGEMPEPEPDFEFTSAQDYQAFGTDYSSKSSVNWTMQRGTLTEDGETSDALLNVVPEPDGFKSLYPTGIPVNYISQANTIIVEPQIIATTSDNYNVILFSGASRDYNITLTVGEDGSLTTIDGEEIVIGAFLTENIDFEEKNYGGYYQITDNVKYLLPNQKMVPNPNYEPEGVYLHASMSVSGYSFYAPLAMIPAYAPVPFKNYTADPADEWAWKIAPYTVDESGEMVPDEANAITATTPDFEFNSVGSEVYTPAQLTACLSGEQSQPFTWGKDYVDESDGTVYRASVYAGTTWPTFTDGSAPIITRANINDFDLYYDGNHATPDKARYGMSKLYLYQGKPTAPLYIEGVNMLVYDFTSNDDFSLKCKLQKVERDANGRLSFGDIIAEAEISNADVETNNGRSLLQWTEFYVEDEFGMSQTLDHLFLDEEFIVVIEGWNNGTFSCYPMIDGYEATNGSQSIYFEMASEEGSVYSFTGYYSHAMVGFINGTYGYLHTTDATDITIPATGGQATIHVEPMLSSIDEDSQMTTTRLFVDDLLEEVPEWLSLDVENEKYTEDEYGFDLVVKADPMTAGEESREATVTVWQEGARMIITVKQYTDGQQDGIATTAVVSEPASGKSYNLAGQQMKTGKGIVVNKGKKIIMK